MTYKYSVNGIGLDQIFDPYISGTKAIVTGYQVSGVDLKDVFAPLYLGTAAPVTGYKVNGADLNTLFAAYGTAQYSLPFNGKTYFHAYTVPVGGAGYSAIIFALTSSSAWQISGNDTGGSGPVYMTGAVPSSAVSCTASFGPVTTIPATDPGNATGSTNMASPTALATGLYGKLQTAVWGQLSGTRGSQSNLTITFYNAAGSPISTSTCLFMVETDGSV